MSMVPAVRRLYSFLHFQSWNLGLWQPPDRRFLAHTLLKSYGDDVSVSKVLFVGIRRYTRRYGRFFKHADFFTIDCDPRVSKFGETHHICDDLLNLSRHREKFGGPFDLVFLNGVIGFGLDDQPRIDEGFVEIARHLKPGGQLVVGFNPSLTAAEGWVRLGGLVENFFPIACPWTGEPTHRFAAPGLSGAIHEYRFFERSAEKVTQ